MFFVNRVQTKLIELIIFTQIAISFLLC